MNLDEKIAFLERAGREKEKQKEEVEKLPELKLTLNEALDGIMAGELRLENGELFEFETREYSDWHIPFVIFKNFYQATQEDKEGVIYVNQTHEVSQIISWPKERMTPINLNQWANMLVNGMAANQMHVKVGKKKQLEHVEYICFDVPTGKGRLYNIVFRIRGKEQQITGNYNCLKEEEDTYGIFLEAMVMALNNWLSGREGGNFSGNRGKKGPSE